jgi:hypothetical protein
MRWMPAIRKEARCLPRAVRLRRPGLRDRPRARQTSPEARADWHAAFAALGRIDGIDPRGCTDAHLQLRRARYERETSWAPPHVGQELA